MFDPKKSKYAMGIKDLNEPKFMQDKSFLNKSFEMRNPEDVKVEQRQEAERAKI